MTRQSLHPFNFKPKEVQLPTDFLNMLQTLSDLLTPSQIQFTEERRSNLRAVHEGGEKYLPNYGRGHYKIDASESPDWTADELPAYLRVHRNQITGPADNAKMVVKMANSESDGLMWDLEDSMVNTWDHTARAYDNLEAGLYGTLTYEKDGKTVGIDPEKFKRTVPFIRVRGLHMSQWGVLEGSVSASLFDTAWLAYRLDLDRLPHRRLHLYVPKSESAAEGAWWAIMFQQVCRARGWPDDAIKCMALVESHSLAYEMDEFIYALRHHITALDLGRWDYMASLDHYQVRNPKWILPDRDAIPHDVPFFQQLRYQLVETCHKRGILAGGGMTALFPDKDDEALDQDAQDYLRRDKGNEAVPVGMNFAWTGNPLQNEIATAAFDLPDQTKVRHPWAHRLDLRPYPKDLPVTEAGTRNALRTAILYRVGVLKGLGAVMIRGTDGKNRMEDLATDRICRVQAGQRIAIGMHTENQVAAMLDEEKAKLSGEIQGENLLQEYKLLCNAALITLEMILLKDFDPA